MRKCLLLLVLGSVGPSLYALPDYEPFADASSGVGTTYAVGANLIGQTNAQGLTWFAAGSGTGQPVISAGNLSVAGLAAASGNSITYSALAGTSARLGLAPAGSPVTTGTLYYSLAFQINGLGSLPTTGAFVAGFNNSTGPQSGQPTVVGARLYTRLSGSGFNLGVNKEDGTAGDISWDSAVHSVGETLFLVGSYTFTTVGNTTDDSSSLWINPDSSTFGAGSAPGATLTAAGGADITGNQIISFLVREASTVEPGSMTLDELRVGTAWADVTPTGVPEPGSGCLLSLSGLVILLRRCCRRRG